MTVCNIKGVIHRDKQIIFQSWPNIATEDCWVNKLKKNLKQLRGICLGDMFFWNWSNFALVGQTYLANLLEFR